MGAILLLLVLIGVPVLEIAVFIRVGDQIGVFPTIALVVATAFVGVALLRRQGLATLRQAQESLDHGEFPVAQAFNGICLLVAGALLLTPGFVTDALGLLLFIPPLREALRYALWRYLAAHGEVRVWTDRYGRGPEGPTIIDGQFHDVTDDDTPPDRGPPDRGSPNLDPPDPGPSEDDPSDPGPPEDDPLLRP